LIPGLGEPLCSGSSDCPALSSAFDFSIGDRAVNLKSLGDSLTISLGGVPPSVAEFAGAAAISVPFSGAIVAAERFRD